MSAPATVAAHGAQAGPAPERPPRRRWIDAALIGVLFSASIAILVTFRREPVFSDDLGYWLRWESLGERSGMANHYRLGMVLSAQFSRLVLGDSLAGYNAVGVLYGAGLVVAVYVLTRLVFPRVVAFASAAMLLTSPVFLEDATLLLPDWPSMFWFVSGLALLVVAATRLETGRHQTIAAVAAGFCFFFMAWVKDGSVPILLAVPICMLLTTDVRRAARLTLVAAGTSLTFLFVEFGVLAAIYGEPLRRIRIILGGHVGRRTSEALGGRVQRQEAPPADADFLTWADLAERYVTPVTRTTSGRWVLVLLAVALLVALVSRSRRMWFLAVPAVIGVGFVVFGVGSVQPLVPLLSMKFRYLSLGWVFVMPLIAAAVWTLAGAVASRVGVWVDASVRAVGATTASVVVVMVGLLAFTGVSDALDRPVFVRSGEDGLHQIAAVVEGLEADGRPLRIVSDGRTQNALSAALPERHHDLLDAASSDLERAGPGDLVIVNRKRIGVASHPVSSGLNTPIAEGLLVPPPNWQLLGRTDVQNFRLYYVEEPSGPEDPRIGPLSTSGVEVTPLVRGMLIGDDPGELVEQRAPGGVLLWMEGVESARLVLGEGSHMRAPAGADAELLAITEPGRLGVRVEMHIEPGLELHAWWLRTYDRDGRLRQNSRMYQATEDGRVSEPGFVRAGIPVSFVDHVEVDPAEDVAFRVVGFVEGTGTITLDRIAFELVPTG